MLYGKVILMLWLLLSNYIDDIELNICDYCLFVLFWYVYAGYSIFE